MKPENETKLKLLLTAVDMIWESSYGSVSVEDICERAGVKKGSFYYAFKSKSDLAVAAFEYHWDHKRPLLDKIFSSQLPPLERLEGYCDLIIKDQLTKYQTFGKMLGCPFCSIGCELSTQDENIRGKVEQIGARGKKYLESLIRDMGAEGLIEVRDVSELANELNSYLVGVLTQAKIENNPKLVERLKHGVLRLLNVKQAAAATR